MTKNDRDDSPPVRSEAHAQERLFAWGLPLVGRHAELAELRSFLVEEPRHRVTLLFGAGGVGKSRLAAAACADAARSGWKVALGHAYPVESGLAYSLFSDALVPVLSELPEGALAGLTRGGEAELRYLFPTLGAGLGSEGPAEWSDPGEFKIRLLWNFVQLLKGYSAREPLLIVLEDLQWADESSLELLHFAARHLDQHQVRFLCTYNDELLDQSPALKKTEGSLLAQGSARRMRLGALAPEDVDELVREAFHAEPVVTRDLVHRLHDWTHGNPLFVLETLKSLVDSGRLRQRDGVWLGWEDTDFELPGSLKEGILARVDRLSESARTAADHAAVVGGPVSHQLLQALTELSESGLVSAVKALMDHHILRERWDGDRIVYDFTHPLLREVLYGELGLARTRLLHAAVARAVERLHGEAATEHAGLLAYHLVRSQTRTLTPKALRYLTAAGRGALARHADVEAANYLALALSVLEESDHGDGSDLEPDVTQGALLGLLAQARQRQGRYQEALDLWESSLDRMPGAPPKTIASVRRAMGLVCYWSGRYAEAITFFKKGLDVIPPEDERGAAVIRLARGTCLQELGASDDARSDIQSTLETAERLGDASLLARAHRALALLHMWVGPPDESRRHAHRAIELADGSGDLNVVFWSHWALAALEGLTGNTVTMASEIAASQAIATRLHSPVLRIWIDELSIERAYATGDWETGLALAERTIALARSLNQKTLLTRLLVWTSFIHLGKGDLERGKALVDEAWTLAGMEGPEPELVDVHTVVPAHIGRAAFYLFSDQREEAISIAERGLEIADRNGYVIWAIHHLLPIMAEALIHTRDLDRAKRVGRRLRRDSQRLGHALGLAWADACDAFVVWLSGDLEGGVRKLRAAQEALEAIPIVPDAARVRRQLAARMADLGDREGALRELRGVHETMLRLGMERELDKARRLFRKLEARPPLRTPVTGSGDLTGRESDIAELVAQGWSSKAIAKELDVSVRTVTKHLEHAYRKLDISSRHQLAEWVRQGKLRRS